MMSDEGHGRGRSATPGLEQDETVVAAPTDATALHQDARQTVLEWSSRFADGEPWSAIEREALEWSGGQPDALWQLIVAARSASAPTVESVTSHPGGPPNHSSARGQNFP